LKKYEKERAENSKQVNKMEQQLHAYFHKTNTPYSYIDDKGIFNFTPAPAPAPASETNKSASASASAQGQQQPQQGTSSVNPFMNMTFNPFVPPNSLFSTPVPTLWTSIFPIKMVEAKTDGGNGGSHSFTGFNPNNAATIYYLQELHIPETKHNASTDEKATYKTEEKKPIFNPFAPAFPGPLFESMNAAFPPFNSKKNTWSNVYCNGTNTDDFALPTKGDFMHTVIYGPPGSGKTEVAKIIGRIFSNLGILNKKIFKKVSRNDLVAGYLGQTAIKTKDMIKASLGGVLFIDEAYSLGNSEKRDSFAKECVDTLCEALSEHKHNWMVIIAGYEKELNDCFFSLNEGLNSRFTWRFKLDAYKPCELKSIYAKQVRDYGWSLAMKADADADADAGTDVIPESWFASRMDYFTTYGRDMETLFTKTKIAHSRRVFCLPMCEKKIVTFADLENGFKLFIENPEVSERKEKCGGGPYMKTLYL